MNRAIVYLAIASGVAISASANDTPIELDPGLYLYETNVYMSGKLAFSEEPYEYCLTPDLATTSLNELAAKVTEDGNCQISNQQITGNRGSADLICDIEDFGMTMEGRLEGEFTKTSYEANATATSLIGPITAKTTAVRKGDCPEGWTPPPGISHK